MIQNGTKRIIVLFLAISVLLSACGQKETATSMHLVKAEGEVGVVDKDGKEISLIEKLGLYSGYQVGTQHASYAWIDLDEVKLAKMDEDSEVEVQKEGKGLTAYVKSGSLFFHVTEPLEEDETFEIRSSTMMVGIRGTCGWVEAKDEEHMFAYILEGMVEGGVILPEDSQAKTEFVEAGEMAELSVIDGEANIRVERFQKSDIPAFVLEELSQEMLEASGLEGEEALEEDRADETEEPQTLTISKTELEYLSSGGGVILTMKDDLCGAINQQGEAIVPHQYRYYYCEPSDDGMQELLTLSGEINA